MSELALLAFGMPGTQEMIILAIILLIFFGPKKLPELARAIGEAVNSFKDGLYNNSAQNNAAPAAPAVPVSPTVQSKPVATETVEPSSTKNVA